MAGPVPPGNTRSPSPRTSGNTMSRYSSTRSSAISAWTTLALPMTTMSCACLRSRTAAARSPGSTAESCHPSAWSSDRDATSLGMAFSLAENGSSRPGQILANICQVWRPSSRAPVSSTSLSPNGSPVTGPGPNLNAHPPCGVPSFPSGSCMTPSRDMNSMTMTWLITILLRCGSCQADELEPLPGTAAPQILDQVVRDALLEQDAPGRGHYRAQFRIPRRRLGRPRQQDMLRILPYPGQVIAGAEPPGPGAVAAHDRARDREPGPVEVTVIAQFAAAGGDRVRDLVERHGRAAFRAQYRRRIRAQLGGGVAEHGRVLADVDDRAADRQRERHELVQGDVEGDAVPGRSGQPLGQAGALGREVQHQDPAGQVVDDDTACLPQFPALPGRPWPAHSGLAGQGPQDQRRQQGPVVQRLGVPGDVRGQGRQQHGRVLAPGQVLEHADRLAEPGPLAGIDQLRQ